MSASDSRLKWTKFSIIALIAIAFVGGIVLRKVSRPSTVVPYYKGYKRILTEQDKNVIAGKPMTPDGQAVRLRAIEGASTPASISEGLDQLRSSVETAKIAHDWFAGAAWLHGEILRRKSDPQVIAVLEGWASDSSKPPRMRAMVALILGTISVETRKNLVTLLRAGDSELATVAWYGLALKEMSSDISIEHLYAFWQGAALSLGGQGLIAPNYPIIYGNIQAGYPADHENPTWQGLNVQLPTEGFDKWTSRIDDPQIKSAALTYAREHPTKDTAALIHQLLPRGDPQVLAWAKDIVVSVLQSDGELRSAVVAILSQTRNPRERESNLLWIHSLEPDSALRVSILQHMAQSTDPGVLNPLVLRELSSSGLSDEAAGRAIRMISYSGSPSALTTLQEIYGTSDSEIRRVMVAQSLGGIHGDSTLQNGRIDMLGTILKDRSAMVRTAAVVALQGMTIDRSKCWTLLQEHLRVEQDAAIRSSIETWSEKNRPKAK
jgi:hypothetical protein